MVGASWPCRIHEHVVERLLNIVHNSPLEIDRVVTEQTKAGCRFLHNHFVARSNGVGDVLFQEADHARLV
jgi:hypothetical protein